MKAVGAEHGLAALCITSSANSRNPLLLKIHHGSTTTFLPQPVDKEEKNIFFRECLNLSCSQFVCHQSSFDELQSFKSQKEIFLIFLHLLIN